jgi:hypothetical protein
MKIERCSVHPRRRRSKRSAPPISFHIRMKFGSPAATRRRTNCPPLSMVSVRIWNSWRLPRPAVLQPAGDSRHLWDCRSHCDDLNKGLKVPKVHRIAGVERKTNRARSGGNEEIDSPRSSWLSPPGDDRREHPSAGTAGLAVKGNRVECRLRTLQSILSARPLVVVIGGMRTCCELGHSDRTDGELERELVRVEFLQVDDHRRVNDAPLWAILLRHGGRSPGTPHGQGQSGIVRGPHLVRSGTWRSPRLRSQIDVFAAGSIPRPARHFELPRTFRLDPARA